MGNSLRGQPRAGHFFLARILSARISDDNFALYPLLSRAQDFLDILNRVFYGLRGKSNIRYKRRSGLLWF